MFRRLLGQARPTGVQSKQLTTARLHSAADEKALGDARHFVATLNTRPYGDLMALQAKPDEDRVRAEADEYRRATAACPDASRLWNQASVEVESRIMIEEHVPGAEGGHLDTFA
jgi:hypothetical protein